MPLENYPVTAEIQAQIPEFQGVKRTDLIDRIKELLVKQKAVLVAHYYTHEDLQEIAEDTGGTVSDSLEMARFVGIIMSRT